MIPKFEKQLLSENPDLLEVEEGPDATPRFDAPSLQLEKRGTKPQKTQLVLWQKQTIHKNSVAAKLRSIGRVEEASTLEHCHTEFTIGICRGCSAVNKFPNRCDLFFCPECQPRLQSDRQKAVEWWTREVHQPKHVVLTCKNTPNLHKGHVQEFRKWFTRLRRSVFARKWLGGFYRFEVTNEGRGWHLHLHALINAGWIDEFQLSELWTKITGGFGRIVRVKDARGKSYLDEVTKYAVKGHQLSAWTPEQIAEFIDAFKGVKTFGVFGSLYGARTKFAEWWKQVRGTKPICSCGESNCNYMTECDYDIMKLQLVPDSKAIPPPIPDSTLQFKFA